MELNKLDFYVIIFGNIIIFLLGFSLSQMIGIDVVDELFFPESSINIGEQQKTLDNINITYEDLNQSEIEHFESIFNNIKEEYLYKNNNWIVVKNMSKYCDNCSGQNIGNGNKIIIKYREKGMDKTICHESLHSYFSNDGKNQDEEITKTHKIIYDIANYRTCFYE